MAANRCPNPKCEYFNRTLPNNAKVCPMCGTNLGNPIASVSDPSRGIEPHNHTPPAVDSPTYQPPAAQPSYQSSDRPPSYPPPDQYVQPALSPAYNPPPRPAPILKLIHTSGREFRLPGAEGCIGRRGQTSNTVPEIDLMGIPNEGIVSRSHARIYWDWSQNTYLVVDNNSRNGTYLNGNPLTPRVPYRLNYGDYLHLGQDNMVCFTVSLG